MKHNKMSFRMKDYKPGNIVENNPVMVMKSDQCLSICLHQQVMKHPPR